MRTHRAFGSIVPAIRDGLTASSFRAASCRSPGLTMLYRPNTERVWCPVIVTATRLGMPGGQTVDGVQVTISDDVVALEHRPAVAGRTAA